MWRDGHYLQSWEWGDFQATQDRSPERLFLVHEREPTNPVGGIQVLWRYLRAGWRIGYAPKGPWVVEGSYPGEAPVINKAFAGVLRAYLRRQRVVRVRCEPTWSDSHRATSCLVLAGLREAESDIQPKHTIRVSLSADVDAILASMESKTRYNIRLASRRGVVIREGRTESDVASFLHLHRLTVARDCYAAHTSAYLQSFLSLRSANVHLLLASVDNEDVAALVLVIWGREALYLYGASGNHHRQDMPNHLLQWEGICRAKAAGCLTYDLWGVSPPNATDDTKFGLYKFKHGFGAYHVWTGCWDMPTSHLYPFLRLTEHLRLQARRKRGAARL